VVSDACYWMKENSSSRKSHLFAVIWTLFRTLFRSVLDEVSDFVRRMTTMQIFVTDI